jgi:cytochrome d ubiquinol oxidase subunit I
VVALEAGWVAAEVGRQPWIVYEQMRVSDAVTNIGAGPIWTSYAIVVVIYALVAWAFLGVLLRMKIRWRHEDAEAAGRSAVIPAQASYQQQEESSREHR